jgi:hypothetical protein
MKQFYFFVPLLLSVLYPVAVYARIFIIQEGNHSASGVHASVHVAKSLNFSAKFNNTAEYYLGNVNQYDINKLYGFSDCYSAHHTNSARFGWVWNDQTLRLEIHAYVYSSSLRSSKFIDTVKLNQKYQYQISVNKSQYEFRLNGKLVTLPRGCSSTFATGYKLYPYFGGDEVAPHQIQITVD